MAYGGNNKPYWWANPDPAKRIVWHRRDGYKISPYIFGKTQTICPHCGEIVFISADWGPKQAMKHFDWCEHKDNDMSEEELVEIVDKKYNGYKPTKMFMNELGSIKLTHEQFIGKLTLIALDDTHKSQAVALTLLYKHFETERANNVIEGGTITPQQIVFNEIKRVDDDEENTG